MRLGEIEERVDLNYLINPGDLGMFSNTPSRKMAVADMRLLIRAVRELGAYTVAMSRGERAGAWDAIADDVWELLEGLGE